MNVLAIGAHPDDIELGCFGTLAAHRKKGDKIFGLILTQGELVGDPKKRLKETKDAANLIDMKLFFGNFQDGNLKEDSSLVSYLDEIIKNCKINIAYTHSPHDRHQDHRAVAQASISASRYLNELYSYESPSVVYPFNPQLFIDVTDTFKSKIKAIKVHKTQKSKTFMRIEAVEGLAKFRAYQAGRQKRLCEGFEVHKIWYENFSKKPKSR